MNGDVSGGKSFSARKAKSLAYHPFKRLLDIILSILGLTFCFPVLVVIALAIYIDDPGPSLFRQQRAGRLHRPFTIYKFRTMKLNAPNVSTEEMRSLGISPYTRLGPLLRRTSLDELPQLFNVLFGDMSLVGPRPALLTQTPVLQGREAAGVHVLRPGITGLAQITGRDDLDDREKVKRDAKYLKEIGLLTDILLILYTLKGISRSDGAY